ncbi:unnamed protein product [Rotaria sp. Silwood2]|nr:unnamed protein product [Rotaria sp. Silwood2]CAF2995548.1 unnamed protein product [Rotaria sp. Silwood2]CAF3331501.1 unnamed protein product [Rotaria sp. Silwood2]CAF4287491.1 unnamed protein product [Rotaria sp. Silwood2]CAF4529616.1 unnamed protein product [Rotaria sp. Silwood2]
MNKLYNNVDWKFYLKSLKNMKFYFRASPSAGNYKWKWLYIGIVFYTDNSTHIKSSIHIRKYIIFPLVLRPVAGLWLPGPRSVQKFFKKVSKYYYSNFSIDKKCYLQAYLHREERRKYTRKTVLCKKTT